MYFLAGFFKIKKFNKYFYLVYWSKILKYGKHKYMKKNPHTIKGVNCFGINKFRSQAKLLSGDEIITMNHKNIIRNKNVKNDALLRA